MRKWVQNIAATSIGRTFNLVGGETGEPVVFASRENPDPTDRAEALKQAGFVGVYQTAEDFALVPAGQP